MHMKFLNCELFFSAKLHYISKNHAKSQKKYLVLKPDMVPYKTKEVTSQFVNVCFVRRFGDPTVHIMLFQL